MTSSQKQRNSASAGRQLDAEWQEVLLQARDKPWLLRLLARQGADIVTRYALWKQRLARLRTGERRRLRQRLGVSIGGAALILALTASPGWGAPNAAMTVTNGTSTIANGDGCSLPEAIINANANNQSGSTDCATGTAGLDTITLQTNISLTAALPVISTAITIEGGGNTIAGNNSFGILNVGSSGNLTLNSATISDGSASAGGGIYNSSGTLTVQNSTISANSAIWGGGIFNNGGALTVQNSALSANSAGNLGGGIYNFDGTLTVENSTLSANSASEGGGIYNTGTSTVKNSTLSSNETSDAGGGINNSGTLTVQNSMLSGNEASAGSGGGIFNNGGTVTVQNSTLSANSAGSGGGGGIDNRGTVTVENSTLSANSASVFGGGIDNRGTLTVQNSTLSANSASKGGGIYNSGTLTVENSTLSGNSASVSNGGIFNYFGAVTVQNSIVAAQTAGDDCYGAITSGGYNIESGTSCGFTNGVNGNNQLSVSGDSLNLGALGSNGGPTQTMALASGSAAIDQIPNGTNGCVAGTSTDQRGAVRADGAGRGGTGCDVGAYEYDSAQKPNAVNLLAFSAAGGGGLAGWAAAALAALGLGAVFGRRRRNDDGLGETGRSHLAQMDSEPDPGRWPYQPPAIVHRGQLELRAGSPLALPEFMDPDNPLP